MTKVSEYLVVAFVVTPKQIARNIRGRLRPRRHKKPKTDSNTSTASTSSLSPRTPSSEIKHYPASSSASLAGDAPVPGSGSRHNIRASGDPIGSVSNASTSRGDIPTVTITASHPAGAAFPSMEANSNVSPSIGSDRKARSSLGLICIPGISGHSKKKRTSSKTGLDERHSSSSPRLSVSSERSRSSSPKSASAPLPSNELPRYMVRSSFVDPVLADTLRERREEVHSGELPV